MRLRGERGAGASITFAAATLTVAAVAATACHRAPSSEGAAPITVEASTSTTASAASSTSDAGASATSSAAIPDATGPARPRVWASFSDVDEDPLSGKPRLPVPIAKDRAYTLSTSTMLTLRRTMCFGSCPVYTVGVTADGTVHFYGEMYTAALGYRSAKIDRAALQGLLEYLRARDFVGLHTHYLRMATDNPTTAIVLRQGDAYKNVVHDESNDTEPRLAEIEKEIDRVLGTARWIGAPRRGRRDHDMAPAPGFPATVLAGMIATPLAAAKRTCVPPGAKHVTLDVAVDDLGNLRASGGGSGQLDALACLQRELHAVVPFADVNEAVLTVAP